MSVNGSEIKGEVTQEFEGILTDFLTLIAYKHL